LRNTVVLDSNLIVSAFLNPQGAASKALQIALESFDIASSKETLAELVDVLKRDKFDKYAAKSLRMAKLEQYAQAVVYYEVSLEISSTITDCTDPKDNKFLALAITAKAKVLISGDKRDLLVMHPYRGIDIVSLREFIDHYERYCVS
jgi:uncharacterized protein